MRAPSGNAYILIVDDDPDVRELLELYLNGEGHRTATAPDGVAALALATRGSLRPDLILADYNLPNGMDGLQVAAKLRDALHREVPVIILTGDISTGTLGDIARYDCVQLSKPVKLTELNQAIERLLAERLDRGIEPHPTTLLRNESIPRHRSSSWSMTIMKYVRRCAPCLKMMAMPLKPFRARRIFSKPIVPDEEGASCLMLISQE